MQKIPTLFLRDENDRAHVTLELNPECEWVVRGEGVATRKYDGTCVMLDEDGDWWARREVKKNGNFPTHFITEDFDPVTGKTQGWEPIETSGFNKFFGEAFHYGGRSFTPGTYELVGPKINGNPENYISHALIKHENAMILNGVPLKYPLLIQQFVFSLPPGWEGIVWHHPDGRMAKLKRKDILLKGD